MNKKEADLFSPSTNKMYSKSDNEINGFSFVLIKQAVEGRRRPHVTRSDSPAIEK